MTICLHPEEFARCLAVVTDKLQHVAARAGVHELDTPDLDSTLAMMPLMARFQARALLNGLQVQAQEAFPGMAFTANYVLKLSEDIWERDPVSFAAWTGAAGQGSRAVR